MAEDFHDEVLREQVRQFNDYLVGSAERYKHLLEQLRFERIQADLEASTRQVTRPIRVTTLHRPHIPRWIAHFAPDIGEWVIKRLTPRRSHEESPNTSSQEVVIEGEYRVLAVSQYEGIPSTTPKTSNS